MNREFKNKVIEQSKIFNDRMKKENPKLIASEIFVNVLSSPEFFEVLTLILEEAFDNAEYSANPEGEGFSIVNYEWARNYILEGDE